jgi:hypothetical protein
MKATGFHLGFALSFFSVCLCGLCGSLLAAEPDPAEADEAALRSADLPGDGPGLVEFFKRRTLGEADRSRVLALIRKLGDDEFVVREQATADLEALGPAARPLLREALSDPDVEVACRARQCLLAVERAGRPAALAAAVRTLARRKPPGAVEALLAFLPHVEDAEVLDDACQALAELGVRKGKADPALVQALADPRPVRRACAGEALARACGPDPRPAVRRLLQDADAGVRQRVALALLEMKDRDAVPALIDLLAEPPRDGGWRVQDALARVGGDKAPPAAPGEDGESRRKCRDAWADWWKDNGPSIDLSRLDLSERLLGYTLLAEMDPNTKTGRVVELDPSGRERWHFEVGHVIVFDAQVVGPDRVLLTENGSRLVTERNFKGEVKWQYAVAGSVPLGARRLPGGDTFVVCHDRIAVVDKDGKERLTVERPNDVAAAARFRDGRMAVATHDGKLVFLDEAGKEVKVVALPTASLPPGTNIEALPGGRVLVPFYCDNKVVEVDGDGKVVWEAPATQPTSVMRLPNGHTLVAGRSTQTALELDRDGKEVRSFHAEGRLYRATQR